MNPEARAQHPLRRQPWRPAARHPDLVGGPRAFGSDAAPAPRLVRLGSVSSAQCRKTTLTGWLSSLDHFEETLTRLLDERVAAGAGARGVGLSIGEPCFSIVSTKSMTAPLKVGTLIRSTDGHAVRSPARRRHRRGCARRRRAGRQAGAATGLHRDAQRQGRHAPPARAGSSPSWRPPGSGLIWSSRRSRPPGQRPWWSRTRSRRSWRQGPRGCGRLPQQSLMLTPGFIRSVFDGQWSHRPGYSPPDEHRRPPSRPSRRRRRPRSSRTGTS